VIGEGDVGLQEGSCCQGRSAEDEVSSFHVLNISGMRGGGKIIAGAHWDMSTEKSTLTANDLRQAIIADSRLFTMGLETGVSDETLYGILRRLREKELQLLKLDGSMLDPEMWKIIYSCLANRRPVEIIDTTM
jgi:hypothetical protein